MLPSLRTYLLLPSSLLNIISFLPYLINYYFFSYLLVISFLNYYFLPSLLITSFLS